MVSIRKGIGISIPKIHIAPCSQIRDGNARQPAASIKRVVTDGSDGVSDGDTGEPAASTKRVVTDRSDGVGNVDTG